MTSTSNAKKRPAPSSSTDQGASKIKKVHPFFSKTQDPQTETISTSKFKWQKPLGARASCLYGINLEPSPSAKVAAFDLDGTLIKSSFGKGNGKGKGKGVVSAQFEWWRPSIPAKLREVQAQGFSIVIISNQALKPAALKTWKEKVESFAAALPDLPFYLFAATAKDEYRKPMLGMWNELVDIFSEGGVSIDIQNSFFVGDAAGRRYGKKDKDFACTDRKWALNVGLPFHTPEEYFLGLAVHTDYVLDGFDVSTVPSLPLFSNTSSPVVKEGKGKGKGKGKEMVLFVGYPCLGKTSLYHRYFKPAGYVHVNQDELGSRAKCLGAAKAALEEGRSCVVDNTNRDVKTRAYYVDLAEKLGVSTRCFLFTGSVELAWHNNLYRALNCPSGGTRRELLPYLAFSGFKASYEAPSVEEGFEEVKEVNWVFEGSEEARRCWSMWLQI